MPAFRIGQVAAVISERRGLQRVRLGPRSGTGDAAGELAYALTELVGPVAPGDEVVYNSTAVDLQLGTGGWHVIHWNLSRGGWEQPGPGHVMKLRYTGLQVDTGVAEEVPPDIPAELGGVPVVACSLHSQMGAVAAVVGARAPGTRVAYVMTDGGALPLALSDLVADLTGAGLLVGTVTTGHAFGGDLEAVSLASGLTVARHRLGADVVIAAMGPGGVGTGSALGFSGLEQAMILDSTAWLGGRAVACVRASSADPRPRHRGVSHHTTTVLDATRSGVDVPVPVGLDLTGVRVADRHRVVEVDPPPVREALAAAGVEITTMGRGPDEDPLFFEACSAAADHTLALLAP